MENKDSFEDRAAAADAQRQKDLYDEIRRSTDYFIGKIKVAAARNPKINQQIFQDYADELNDRHPAMAREMYEAHRTINNRAALMREIENIRERSGTEIRDEIYKKHPKDGELALQAVACEMQPKSIFFGPIKAIYNSDSGGPQWGGIIGFLGAGFLGYQLTQGAGTLMNIIGTLAVAGIGAYAAHRLVDPQPQPLQVPDLQCKKTGPIASSKKQQKIGADAPDFEAMVRNSEDHKPSTDVRDIRDLGINLNNKSPEQSQGIVS